MCTGKFAVLSAILVLIAPLLVADDFSSVSATSQVITGLSPVAGCGGTVMGSSSASLAFMCDIQGFPFGGSAQVQTGVGPYGIGFSAQLTAASLFLSSGSTISNVSFEWSEEVAIEGASGNGFVSPTMTGYCAGSELVPLQVSYVDINLWGQTGLPSGSSGCGFLVNPIPVTFDTPYVLTLSGFLTCEGDSFSGCQSYGTYVSNLVFTDSQGNQLTGLSLVAVREVSALAMLATTTLLAGLLRFIGQSSQKSAIQVSEKVRRRVCPANR